MRPHPLLERYYATEEERQRRVRSWFDQSAPCYDQITQAMSFGSGHWYRRRSLARAGLGPGAAVLDVACGTGVLATAARAIVGARGVTVAVRIGFDDNRSLGRKETGSRAALPVFRDIMLRAYADRLVGEVPEFPRQIEDGIDLYLALRTMQDLSVPLLSERTAPGRGALLEGESFGDATIHFGPP